MKKEGTLFSFPIPEKLFFLCSRAPHASTPRPCQARSFASILYHIFCHDSSETPTPRKILLFFQIFQTISF